jgi:HEAT repeat protein
LTEGSSTAGSSRPLSPRIAGLRAAAEAGHAADAVTARSLLDDADAGVRAAAVGALLRAGALTSADLAVARDDPSPAVRRRAAEVMAAAAVELRAPIVGLLADPDASVVEAAAWAAGECDPPPDGAVERLIDLAAGHDDALVREAAVAALGAIGDERGLPAILAATADKPAVRRRAVIALAPFSGPAVDAAIERALGDRDWQVRQAAEDLR